MIFKHISYSVFINPAAILIIFVGTVASVLNSFTGKELKNIGKLFGLIFGKDKSGNEAEIIGQLINLSQDARKDGILSLESKANDIQDPFMRKGIKMIVDGGKEEYILDVLSAEVEAMEKRHSLNAGIFSSAGAYAPTLGVLGAVFGLIAAMSHIDNTDMMAEAIAAAFIATILGIFTGYVLWNPFANKLKIKSKHEALEKNLIIEGLLGIQRGESPSIIKDKLLALLPQSKQLELGESDSGKDR